MAALIDPTVKGRYPVVLGEGMLDKTSNDIFTGIRYNHKPDLSASDAPAHARLKPSLPGKTTSYDLSYTDGGSSYAYTGTRSVDDNQYVLHFDPERKVFILDKVDSTFNLNITRLPSNSDPARLARQYPHLDNQKPDAKKNATDRPKPKPAAKPPAKNPAQQTRQPRRKTEKKQPQPPKDVALSLPKPEPPKQDKKSSNRAEKDEDDEDEDDGDGDLLVEYPGGNNAAAKLTDFSPAFPAFPQPRRFDDFMDQRDSEGDADGESDGDVDFDFKLPSPVNHNIQVAPAAADGHADDAFAAADEPGSAADMEDDLEKEMEIAFEDLANSQEGSPDGGDESEISEED
ncbi:RNA polymerase II transcription elongation factor domain-containing protein [Hirsutella rhossiliensis]|uniref:RNA polymerase II transcription elongation factor domain-containing protein n=1 Tax=Hirsutella rhossiliensis TaxID=111463 RepID=A0A9P8SK22_9HYPO|nr:RNA polymerase II transcription elongation factor domain-containing protein [Hirsutella rhossiliensis]KAH0964310.1 RNA polymerase II transcription elongation factor domain-containing protein [Hirsutella rhossiliensis]